ncbi:MAG: DNA mismatch repair endonuclease MutL, partial [Clostridia bacterium]|nr:DNA mismatch repair endonuclease MutL [Clostridia bacterium]
MGKINKLDESVYNRLAAGEVIENPASIVKELVENSIDAGASKIKIIIENGGKKLISVHDNGSGIAEDDLLLSLESHATSKLLDFNDLSTIATLGFRGEALASILAVSEIEIKTKTINDENANIVIGKGGKILNRTISNREVGTSITVTNLFYNTQARWRFLKNEKGEEANITKLVSELIISNPDISFEYNVDGKQIYLSLGYGFNEAVKTIMGNKIFDNLLPIAKELNDYKLTGFIAIPSTNAIISNKTKQIFIVNGRLFNDLSISPVIQNAYNERLMKRTFPIIILDIIVPFDEIDINVSPNKREVRFSNKNLLHSLIYSSIKDTLIKYENSKNESILMELSGKSNNNVDSEQHFSFDSNIENESTTANFLQNDIIINKNLFDDNN